MLKFFNLLILFYFLFIPTLTWAQEAAILVKPTIPSNNALNRDQRLPMTQWDETNQQIRDNFAPFNTIPVYENEKLGVNIGPAQVQIIFPFF